MFRLQRYLGNKMQAVWPKKHMYQYVKYSPSFLRTRIKFSGNFPQRVEYCTSLLDTGWWASAVFNPLQKIPAKFNSSTNTKEVRVQVQPEQGDCDTNLPDEEASTCVTPDKEVSTHKPPNEEGGGTRQPDKKAQPTRRVAAPLPNKEGGSRVETSSSGVTRVEADKEGGMRVTTNK